MFCLSAIQSFDFTEQSLSICTIILQLYKINYFKILKLESKKKQHDVLVKKCGNGLKITERFFPCVQLS